MYRIHRSSASLAAALAAVAVAAPSAAAQIALSEVFFNPIGADNGQEGVELRNISGAPLDLTGWTFLAIEGDATGAGVVDVSYAIPAGTIVPAGGLLLIRDAASLIAPAPDPSTIVVINDFNPDLENGSNTYVIGFGTAPATTTDLDSDNDGTLNAGAPAGFTVVDAVGVLENDAGANVGYADDFGFVNVGPFTGPTPASHTPDSLYRIFNAGGTSCAWAGGDIIGTNPGGPYSFDVANGRVFGITEQALAALDVDLGNLNVLPDADGDGVANGCDTQTTIFGHVHTKLGSALLGITGGKLVVANIGSSGQDGVEIALGGISTGQHADFSPALVLADDGDALDVSAVGTFSGAPGTNLGGAGLKNVAGQLEAHADFSALGATQVRVQVYDNGQFVGQQIVPAFGKVADLGLAISIGVGGCGKLPPDPPCIIIPFDHDLDITPVGGSALFGDELRMLADNATGTIDGLDSLSAKGTGLDSVTIGCESGFGWASYGSGCPGSNGLTPRINVTGCTGGGDTVTVAIDRGLPSSVALLFLGASQVALPIGGGCTLNVFPIISSVALPLDSTGAIAVPAVVPAGLGGASVKLQVFVVDPAKLPLGASNSNGGSLTLEN